MENIFAFALVGDGDLHPSRYEADDGHGSGPALDAVYSRPPDRPFLFAH